MDEAAGSSVDHPYPHLHRRLHDTQVAVGTFISGTLLYVLSRQWQDLLAVNVFHLHPLPFCDTAHGNLSQLPCTPEAGSGVQFLFAAGMLCVAAVVQHVSLRNEARWPSLTIVPRMAGMCVGWAFGFAALQALSEMEAALGGAVCSWVLGKAVSACATLLLAVLDGAPGGSEGGGEWAGCPCNGATGAPALQLSSWIGRPKRPSSVSRASHSSRLFAA